MKKEKISLEAQAKKLRYPITALEAARAWGVTLRTANLRLSQLEGREMLESRDMPGKKTFLYTLTEKFFMEWFEY